MLRRVSGNTFWSAELSTCIPNLPWVIGRSSKYILKAVEEEEGEIEKRGIKNVAVASVSIIAGANHLFIQLIFTSIYSVQGGARVGKQFRRTDMDPELKALTE